MPDFDEQINVRFTPNIRPRLEALAARYEQTISSAHRMALVIGIEALENLHVNLERPITVQAPGDQGPSG
jgi:predicted DNA-binding protein